MVLHLGPKIATSSQSIAPKRNFGKFRGDWIKSPDNQLILLRSIHHWKHVVHGSQSLDFFSITKKRDIAVMSVGISDQQAKRFEPSDILIANLINSLLLK